MSGCASQTSMYKKSQINNDIYEKTQKSINAKLNKDYISWKSTIYKNIQINNDIYEKNSKSINTKLNKSYSFWKDTPYRYGGVNKNGIDCSALVQKIYKNKFKTNLPRTTWQQIKEGKKVKKNNLKKGDLVFFKTSSDTLHVGIYKGKDNFINASSSKGVIISSLSNSYWNARYLTSRRILNN